MPVSSFLRRHKPAEARKLPHDITELAVAGIRYQRDTDPGQNTNVQCSNLSISVGIDKRFVNAACSYIPSA